MVKNVVVLLLACVLLTGGVAAQDQGMTREQIQEIAGRVVLIGIVEGGDIVGNGSGTIVDPSGIIYTNAHVIEGAQELVIFMLEDIQELPVPRYLATPVYVSEELDFAILQIDRDADGRALNPDSLNLPFMDIQLADVQIGDEVRIFGYPGIGDGYMVVTSGEIVTIQNGTVNGERLPVWYRTDSEFSGGNSGGLAVDESGLLVGIPTWVVTEDRTDGKLGGILPFSTVLASINIGATVVDEPLPQGQPNQQEQQQVANLSFTLTNESNVEVCSVFISPTTASTWGQDQLGSSTIAPGGSFTFEVEPDIYDVLLEDCSGDTLSDSREIDITQESISLSYAGDGASDSSDSTVDSQPATESGTYTGGVSISVTCAEGASFTNGIEFLLRDVPPGENFTATVIGMDGFDPVLAYINPDTGEVRCSDDASNARNYQANLPTSGDVTASTLNSQLSLTQNSSTVDNMSLVVGGYNSDQGQFMLLVEGLAISADDDPGDVFSVQLTPGLVSSGEPLVVYMIAADNQLDPLFYLADTDLNPFVDGDGLTVQCDDAGNAERCWGTSSDLSQSTVTYRGDFALPGGEFDSMLEIPLTDFDPNPTESFYLTFVTSSFERRTNGNYVMVFQGGTR